MAIRTVITRGFGNGTFTGTIPLVVTRGYVPGVGGPFSKSIEFDDYVRMSSEFTSRVVTASEFVSTVGETDASSR